MAGIVESQGDRVGLCVTQLDAGLLERGVVCTPGHLAPAWAALAHVHPIAHFRGAISSGAKFHVTFLHNTVMAKATFLSRPAGGGDDSDLRWDSELSQEAQNREQMVLLEMEQAAVLGSGMLLIGSKLDMDSQGKACRLGLHQLVTHLYVARWPFTLFAQILKKLSCSLTCACTHVCIGRCLVIWVGAASA